MKTNILIMSIFITMSLLSSGYSKSFGTRQSASIVFQNLTGSEADLQKVTRTFESMLTPYLQARQSYIATQAQNYIPTDADYFTIAKRWASFSQNFRELYTRAMDIPPNLKVFTSPGGHFDILYSVTGIDSVDITDTVGYSQTDWRTKSPLPNGIPDYIDETAFACDSAWQMEVDRFGFNQPQSYVSTRYNSSRYKIYIHKLESGFYGTTPPMPQIGKAIGTASFIELRNEWSEWNTLPMNYNVYPEKGIRVTCMHEFFHGIQYAMVKKVVDNIYLDDFPVTWTEATATLMEDQGFDDIDDYLQYWTYFFSSPIGTMLDNYSTDNTVYKNCILTMYLFQKATNKPDIDFIKNMYLSNYKNVTPFLVNVRTTSIDLGHTWAELLGSFFTNSYYTGSRFVANRFLPDGSKTDRSWQYSHDKVDKNNSIQKRVNWFGMETFSFINNNRALDSLPIFFNGEFHESLGDTNAIWNVHCILKKNTNPVNDSIFSIPLSNGIGQTTVYGWQNFTEALVIAVNAKNDTSRLAKVTFIAPPPIDSSKVALEIFPNPVRIKSQGAITINGLALLELWIYTVDGTLVTHYILDNPGSTKGITQKQHGITWKLCNTNGKTISPGTYYVQIGYKDYTTRGLKKKLQKIFVLP